MKIKLQFEMKKGSFSITGNLIEGGLIECILNNMEWPCAAQVYNYNTNEYIGPAIDGQVVKGFYTKI